MSREAAFAAIDAIADRWFDGRKAPGLAYGVVVDGELAHSRGLGTARAGEAATPDADTVFRIASMTKSFTAATVLALRDEGRLTLDDPLAVHLPELDGLRGPTRDSPQITIRHLLTMTAGLPTDDPWGDRQQALDPDAFLALLRRGVSLVWAPGTRFEYSNLGYGILGRVVTRAAGREYREAVDARVLAPLGLTATTYLEEDVPSDRLARGYLWRDDALVPEPIDAYGALASMGGIFTTVRDLARWVAGFLDAFPPRDDPDESHPLTRAARREMQQPAVLIETEVTHPSPEAQPELDASAYGLGLFVLEHLRWGRIVGHSGGYPGYGSNMRWHPPSGVGVIVLANGRYAPATLLGRQILESLLSAEIARPRRVRAATPTLAARAAVESLLDRWDDGLAEQLFAMNVELDEPIERRRAFIERLREVHGSLRPDPLEQPESRSPFHLEWWLVGDRGRVKAEILLSPEAPPRVQTLTLTSVPEPPPELDAAAARIVSVLAAAEASSGGVTWPADLDVDDRLDVVAVGRALRAAEARFGPLRLARPVAGDGDRRATFRLVGDEASLDLALEREVDSGKLTAVTLVPEPLGPPPFD